MTLGVSSCSFNRLIHSGQITQFDTVGIAAEMGFSFIEFTVLEMPEGEDKLSYARRLREACDLAGIAVGNYTIGADFLNGSDGDLEAEVRRLHAEVDTAVVLGASGMRHDVSSGWRNDTKASRLSAAPAENFTTVLPRLARGCRMVTEYAAEKGIRTMSENHGYFAQDSIRIESLIQAVNRTNYGALIDIGNFLCADEPPALAVTRLAPYAFHVHVKDFLYKSDQDTDPGEGWFKTRNLNRLRGAIIGHGVVPVKQCLQIMKQAGYTGSVAIEFEGMEDPMLGVRIGSQNLKAYLAD